MCSGRKLGVIKYWITTISDDGIICNWSCVFSPQWTVRILRIWPCLYSVSGFVNCLLSARFYITCWEDIGECETLQFVGLDFWIRSNSVGQSGLECLSLLRLSSSRGPTCTHRPVLTTGRLPPSQYLLQRSILFLISVCLVFWLWHAR